jgi:hypothetical protein
LVKAENDTVLSGFWKDALKDIQMESIQICEISEDELSIKLQKGVDNDDVKQRFDACIALLPTRTQSEDKTRLLLDQLASFLVPGGCLVYNYTHLPSSDTLKSVLSDSSSMSLIWKLDSIETIHSINNQNQTIDSLVAVPKWPGVNVQTETCPWLPAKLKHNVVPELERLSEATVPLSVEERSTRKMTPHSI